MSNYLVQKVQYMMRSFPDLRTLHVFVYKYYKGVKVSDNLKEISEMIEVRFVFI